MSDAPAGSPPATVDERGVHVGVVAGHGEIAAGLVSAVAQITGRGELLLPMSNRGLGAADIEASLRAAVAAGRVRALFTDLPSGSCTIAARRVLRDHPALVLVTGVNLPTLVDFVCRVDGGGADAATSDAVATVTAAADRGRAALTVVVVPPSPPPAPAV